MSRGSRRIFTFVLAVLLSLTAMPGFSAETADGFPEATDKIQVTTAPTHTANETEPTVSASALENTPIPTPDEGKQGKSDQTAEPTEAIESAAPTPGQATSPPATTAAPETTPTAEPSPSPSANSTSAPDMLEGTDTPSGKTEAPCSCMARCSAETPDADCPVCSGDATMCAGANTITAKAATVTAKASISFIDSGAIIYVRAGYWTNYNIRVSGDKPLMMLEYLADDLRDAIGADKIHVDLEYRLITLTLVSSIPKGKYLITTRASETSATVPEAFGFYTVLVDDLPAFSSANNTTFEERKSGSFTVTTSNENIKAKLTTSSALPDGVQLVDNGDGTATISGTPASGSAGSWPIEITATNELGSTKQSFTLTVNQGEPENVSVTSNSKLHVRVLEGYDPQGDSDTWLSIELKNNEPTPLDLDISLNDGTNFILPYYDVHLGGSGSGDTATIAIKPHTGLSEGFYTDTVIFSLNGKIVASARISLTVGNPDPAITVTAPQFAPLEEGYTASPQPILIENTSGAVITIESVTVSQDSAFEISGGGNSIGVCESLDTWKIAPKPGLATGAYTDEITVTYNGGFSKTAQVGVTVVSAPWLEITGPAFDRVLEGYAQPAAKNVTIKNLGSMDATIEDAYLWGEGFSLEAGANDVAANSENTGWKVRPEADLKSGTYTCALVVAYDDNRTAMCTLIFKVSRTELEITPIDFGAAGEGEQIDWMPVEVTNHTAASQSCTVELEDADGRFEIVYTSEYADIPADGTGSQWKIRPIREKMQEGWNTAKVRVIRNGTAEDEAEVKVYVEACPLTVDVEEYPMYYVSGSAGVETKIGISNEYNHSALIGEVSLSADDAFELRRGNLGELGSGGTDTSWRVTKKTATLAPGSYNALIYVRNVFSVSSCAVALVVTDGEQKSVRIADISKWSLIHGYGEQDYVKVRVENTTAQEQALYLILSDPSGAFEMDESDADAIISVPAQGVNTQYQVRPRAGLSQGTYTATLRLTDAEGTEVDTKTVTVTVSGAEITVYVVGKFAGKSYNITKATLKLVTADGNVSMTSKKKTNVYRTSGLDAGEYTVGLSSGNVKIDGENHTYAPESRQVKVAGSNVTLTIYVDLYRPQILIPPIEGLSYIVAYGVQGDRMTVQREGQPDVVAEADENGRMVAKMDTPFTANEPVDVTFDRTGTQMLNALPWDSNITLPAYMEGTPCPMAEGVVYINETKIANFRKGKKVLMLGGVLPIGLVTATAEGTNKYRVSCELEWEFTEMELRETTLRLYKKGSDAPTWSTVQSVELNQTFTQKTNHYYLSLTAQVELGGISAETLNAALADELR